MVDIQKSLMFEEIVTDTDNRRFSSLGTVEVYDRHNELLPIDKTFKRSLDDWMSQGGIILDNHSHKPVAKALRWEHTTKNNLPAVRIIGEVFKNRAGDKVWEDMKDGKKEGLSVGGSFLSKEEDDQGTIMRGLEINEVSIVNRTGNQGAVFEAMSIAKSADNQISVEDEKSNIDTEQQDKISDLEIKINNLTQMVEEINQTVTGTPSDEVETKEEVKEEVVEDKEESTEEPKPEVEKSEVKEEVKEENVILKALQDISNRLESLEKSKEVTKSEEVVKVEEVKEVVKTLKTEEPAQNSDNEISNKSFMKDLDARIQNKQLSPEEAIQEIKRAKQ